MSQIVDDAIERLRQMPDERQEMLARLLLHEIDEDQRWLKSTETHADKLRGLVADFLATDDRGECEPLDQKSL